MHREQSSYLPGVAKFFAHPQAGMSSMMSHLLHTHNLKSAATKIEAATIIAAVTIIAEVKIIAAARRIAN
jgi:hypothetical protein